MKFCSPESKGVSSENILKFVKKLDDLRFASHDFIIMRGGEVLYEAYW